MKCKLFLKRRETAYCSIPNIHPITPHYSYRVANKIASQITGRIVFMKIPALFLFDNKF